MRRITGISLVLLSVATVGYCGPIEDLPQHSQLSEKLHASGQPSLEALTELKKAGITTVIDLRPAEETPQRDERAEAEAAGLKFEALPINGRAGLTRENVVAFDALLKKHADEPTLAHCSSSNRVGALMALRAAWLQGRPVKEALEIGEKAGLKGLKADVEALLQPEPDTRAGH
jgi:uncharacterized protein (TIGR01244 family)